MANHSYIDIQPSISVSEAEELLRRIVRDFWGDRMKVEAQTNPREWIVSAPGTALPKETAGRSLMAPLEDYGFILWLHKDGTMLEFRHPINNWEWWAQNKVEQQLAFELAKIRKVVSTDDGSSGPQKIDPQGCKDTYRQYITRKFKEPYSEDDLAWFEKLLSRAPEGFRD